mmetsp:Transcript_31511/g.61679  ORF Transcript_31511/g.61679 Transcript_31511/m.61679 type:complete len:146 (+) Transcript_31511:70-507(+)
MDDSQHSSSHQSSVSKHLTPDTSEQEYDDGFSDENEEDCEQLVVGSPPSRRSAISRLLTSSQPSRRDAARDDSKRRQHGSYQHPLFSQRDTHYHRLKIRYYLSLNRRGGIQLTDSDGITVTPNRRSRSKPIPIKQANIAQRRGQH